MPYLLFFRLNLRKTWLVLLQHRMEVILCAANDGAWSHVSCVWIFSGAL